jgi:predicted outer membrane repeat protein
LGGGIYNSSDDISPATVTISNSTLSSNSASTSGGAIYNEAVSHFAVGPARATLTINNSTLSDNSASTSGGGIYNVALTSHGDSARLTITNSTLSGNSAASFGGGIYNDGATVTIGETILNAGASGANIDNNFGTITSLGYNLSSDDASAVLNGTGDQNSTSPLLGPLQNNGGSTFTHALLTGSPAIDAGAPPLDFDQRGPNFARVVNGRIDIGAFEVQATVTSIPPAAPIATNATGVTNNNFTANWNSVSNATGYRLDVAKNSSFKGGSFVAGYHNLNVGNVTSRFVGGLSANTTYYFRVRAFNSNGVSPSSNVITVTTSP